MEGLEVNVHQQVAVTDKIKEDLVEEVEDGEDTVDSLESGEGLFNES
jgi:hypothetical protein